MLGRMAAVPVIGRNVVEIGTVSIPTVSRAAIVAAPSLMPLPRARLRTLRLD